jgi:hypothetical protein
MGLVKSFEALASRFGSKWAYKLRVRIMAIDLLSSPSFVKSGGYPDYYTMILDDVMHGRPIMSEELWQGSQEFSAREAQDFGENFRPEDYSKCVNRALRLVPIYRPKTKFAIERDGALGYISHGVFLEHSPCVEGPF